MRHASQVGRASTSATTATARVRAWVEGVVTQATNPQGAYATRPFASHHGRLAERFPAEIAKLAALLSEPLLAALRDARDEGELPGINPERDAEAIYQLAVGWLQRKLVTDTEPTAEDAAHIATFAMNALCRGSTLAVERSSAHAHSE